MPIHEFQCPTGHVFEKLFLTFDAVQEKVYCKECRTIAQQIISVPGAPILKGDGWTPKFSTPEQSQIGGVPVKNGDDPVEIAKKVVRRHGGGKALTGVVKNAK